MSNIVKKTTFFNPLDLLAPHSCRGCGRIGSPLCDCCKKNIIANHYNICPICKSPNPSGRCPHCQGLPPIYVVDNRANLIGDLIHDYKYQSLRALSISFAEILDQILPPLEPDAIIIPLPTASPHVRERGFDHTKLIAKKLTKYRKSYTLTTDIIIRTKNTIQVGSRREKRLAQAKSAFKLSPRVTINPQKTYLLLDDVWTTGASMQSAYNLLHQAGATKITICLLARS